MTWSTIAYGLLCLALLFYYIGNFIMRSWVYLDNNPGSVSAINRNIAGSSLELSVSFLLFWGFRKPVNPQRHFAAHVVKFLCRSSSVQLMVVGNPFFKKNSNGFPVTTIVQVCAGFYIGLLLHAIHELVTLSDLPLTDIFVIFSFYQLFAFQFP